MQKLPHYYHAQAQGTPTGSVITESENLPVLHIAAPKQFDGPGDKWSPEELLVAMVADCIILTFRAMASASKLEWSELSCEVKGTLEMVERKMQFTEMFVYASLQISSEADTEKASRVLEKAESDCLITNSLTAKSKLETKITLTS